MSRRKIESHLGHRVGGALLTLLVASLCANAQRTSRPASAIVDSKTGTISGRVINENGQPHVNIDVLVRPDTPEGLPVTQTTTTRDGVFKVSGLEPGRYNVSAAVPAYMPKSLYPSQVVYKDGDLVTLVLIKGGVVTGTVTDAKGDPVVGIGVRVRMVTDETGRSYSNSGFYFDNMTDDRGVYRVYGVPTGTYVVSADGSIEDRSVFSRMNVKGFSNDLPTYAPSSNRAGADEISVRAGEEVSNVNIRYRGERGNTITGIVNGTYDERRMNVTLSSIADNGPRWYNQARGPGREFIFEAVPDGEYQLAASTSSSDNKRQQSESLFLNVRGADIKGVELAVAPAASINGIVVLEALKVPPPECTEKRPPQFPETSVSAWQQVIEGARKKPQLVVRAGRSTPNAEGKITLSDLAAGDYYFALRFSSREWFLKSIAFAPPNGDPIDATRAWTHVKPGDQLAGLTFTLAQGAGLVNGQITVAEGQKLPEKLVIFLVPAEPERADDVLRYSAFPVDDLGRFWINAAPGRYWLLVQPGTDDTRSEVSKIRLPDGTASRASLRAAAKEAKTEIEVKPCQDVPLRLPF